ncbi:hypothetical protein [Fusobacterium gastrosuis]|uniref:hypothetical protein n=1 Tax=Fusobacterium gastrosuis TaxID=1755100 RepID=UPI002A939D5D|nr:hypothetical protein [Fusobacterium gastrosuis]
MKTIKQIADELKVSKDKIKYQSRKLPSNYLVKRDGITYIKNEGIQVIYSNIIGNIDKVIPSEIPINNTHYIESLNSQLAIKDKQLQEKDNQIKSLLEKLDQEQKLHLATIQDKQQLQIELKEIKEENKQVKLSFWDRILGKNNS